MDQRLIVLYLARKRLILLAISKYFETTLRMEAVNYQFVMYNLREVRCSQPNPPMIDFEPESQLDDSDNTILLTLVQ
jgi:hypothetical protein